jgi:hypothetical protein
MRKGSGGWVAAIRQAACIDFRGSFGKNDSEKDDMEPTGPFFSPEDLGKYNQFQGNTPHCGDFALSIAGNIYRDFKGESHSGCDVAAITQYLDSVPGLRIPFADAMNKGTLLWGINAVLKKLGIPYAQNLFGRLEDVERELMGNRIVLVCIGQIGNPFKKEKSWAHYETIVGQADDEFILLDSRIPQLQTRREKKMDLLKEWFFPPFHPYWSILIPAQKTASPPV